MKPNIRLTVYYSLECDCSGVLDDGRGASNNARLRRLATKHRQTCNATMRLNREVTYIWTGPSWPR